MRKVKWRYIIKSNEEQYEGPNENQYEKSSENPCEESQYELFETSKKEKVVDDEINLAYAGNKHPHSKGKNSERRDILYKNFLRATRRYNYFIKNIFNVNK